MAVRMNPYAVSYASAREIERAAACHGKRLGNENYFGAPVLYFEYGGVHHYRLMTREEWIDYERDNLNLHRGR